MMGQFAAESAPLPLKRRASDGDSGTAVCGMFIFAGILGERMRQRARTAEGVALRPRLSFQLVGALFQSLEIVVPITWRQPEQAVNEIVAQGQVELCLMPVAEQD